MRTKEIQQYIKELEKENKEMTQAHYCYECHSKYCQVSKNLGKIELLESLLSD
tara:strand:- start:254 stop:412 length:159 start_codon:yes stop_codon:yes gene_type:complete